MSGTYQENRYKPIQSCILPVDKLLINNRKKFVSVSHIILTLCNILNETNMSITSRKLNYDKLMALKPFIYCTITNSLGQSFDLVEHPIQGDEEQVIIVYHAEKLAIYSTFYDTNDMESNEDYMPVYIYGELHFNYEIN